MKRFDWRAIFYGWLFAVVGARFLIMPAALVAMKIIIPDILEKKEPALQIYEITATIAIFACLCIAGFITGRSSRRRPMLDAVVVGILSIVCNTLLSSVIENKFSFGKLINWRYVLQIVIPVFGALLGGYFADARRGTASQDHPTAALPKKVSGIVLAIGFGTPLIFKTAAAIFDKNRTLSQIVLGQLNINSLLETLINVLPFAVFVILAKWRLQTSPKELPSILLPRKIGLAFAFGVVCFFSMATHIAFWEELYGEEQDAFMAGFGWMIYNSCSGGLMPIGYAIGWLVGMGLLRIRTMHEHL